MLINAVKNVTSALGTMMQVTKLAIGKNMQQLAHIFFICRFAID